MNRSVFLRQFRVYHVRSRYASTPYHSIDMYTLGATRSGILIWIHNYSMALHHNKKKLQRRMYRLNRREGVPTLQGLGHGYRLTGKQFDKLASAGCLDCTKIKHRGNTYVVS